MRYEKTVCDGCGSDLTTTRNSVDYRLVLGSESKPGYGAGCYTDMMISPPIARTHHFCNLGCLDHWRDREHHESALWKAWWDKWKTQHGTKDAAGDIQSYPVPERDVTAPVKKEFESAALAAFPMNQR